MYHNGHGSEVLLIGGFLAIVFGMPASQTALELVRRERVQSTDLFRYAPSRKNLRRFEKTLEDRWWGQTTVRPLTQWLLCAVLRDPGSKALIGRDGWVFYRPGVRYAVEGDKPEREADDSQWLESRRSVSRRESVVREIVRFRDQLRQRQIELVVVPVPGKESVYPDKLTPRAKVFERFRSPTADLMADLERAGVATVDLFELFRQARKTSSSSTRAKTLYLATDTHWTPDGARLAAAAVAEKVRQLGGAPEYPRPLPAQSVRVARHGDVLEMTQIPGLSRRFSPEVVTCIQVTDRITGLMVPGSGARDGAYMNSHLKDTPREPTVLLLGDSYSRIYQLPEPQSLGDVIDASHSTRSAAGPVAARRTKRLLPGSAGFPSLLASALQSPLDYIVSDGGAATDVRQRLSVNAEILENKKVVVWEFTERDIALGRRGWQDIPLPPQL